MKISFRFIAKIGLLLVFIGFLMPVFSSAFGSGRDGFGIAKSLMNSDKYTLYGLLTYLSIIAALVGVAVGVFLLIGMRKKISPTIDWIIILVCIVSGLIVYFGHYSGSFNFLGNKVSTTPKLDTGGIMILAGWIVALVSQIFSGSRREV